MKTLNKSLIIIALVFSFVIGIVSPNTTLAATTPNLGTAATYGALTGTFNYNLGVSTITGVAGYPVLGVTAAVPGGGGTLMLTGTTETANLAYTTAGADQEIALTNLNNQANAGTCTVLGPGPLEGISIAGGPAGTFPPGCYTRAGALNITAGGIVTLNGPGTYIFRSSGGAITTGATSIVRFNPLNPGSACDVFWTAAGTTTLGGASTFLGTVIDNAGISIGNATSWLGRALAYGAALGNITADNTNTITVPTCTSSSLIIQGGQPLERNIPPLISILKVPTPLALPYGPGLVTYDYTVSNIGTVVISDVRVNDDKCSTISFISGDTNNDLKLDLNEIWKYRCTSTLSQTTTNIVTAIGQSKGLITTDTAQATVVVGMLEIPPLIHVVKRPNIFLLPVGGGWVTYTYTVTNPGTEPLNNVSITDDKCTGLPGRVVGHPGDLNKNNLLENTEAWSFTCQSNLAETTTNIGTARGNANGFTATDSASATVVVSPVVVFSPGLPKTGFPSKEKSLWNKIFPVEFFISLPSFRLIKTK